VGGAKKLAVIGMTAGLLSLGLGAYALAAEGKTISAAEAEPIIAYRQTVMKSMGAHIAAIAMVAKGEVGYTGHVEGHAKAIAAVARMIPEIFPAGSGVGKSHAKPEIWQDWDKFKAGADNLAAQADKMAALGAGGDVAQIGAQLGQLGKACGGCHEAFREKEKAD
jgi:cytochrome c556